MYASYFVVCIQREVFLYPTVLSRLGRGYGLHVTKKKAAIITDCLQTAEKATPHDAILLHTGVNDLKTTGTEDASQRLVTCVKTILTTNQKVQVIVSKATPTTRPDLTAKRELFNALCFAALHDSHLCGSRQRSDQTRRTAPNTTRGPASWPATQVGTWRASFGRNSGDAATVDPNTSKPTGRQTLTATDEGPADGPAYPSRSSPHRTIATTSHRATGDSKTTSQRGGVTTAETTDRTPSRDGGNAMTHDVAATTTTTGGTTSPLPTDTATTGAGKCNKLGSPPPCPPPPHPRDPSFI